MKKNSLALLACLALAGCDSGNAQENSRLSVVATIAPVGEWVSQIARDHADVAVLAGEGTDPHSYQPTAKDMALIAECDLFVYVGGESEEWANDVIETVRTQDAQNICLLDELGELAREEEIKEGMDAEEEASVDEHVWLSLRNAQFFCAAIADMLGEIDPAHANAYKESESEYRADLMTLDRAYAATTANGGTLVFADRFPFRYLFDDYGLDYYAAFAGCSAETEASFSTVAFLAEKLDALGSAHVIVIEGSDQKLAHTVIGATRDKDKKILVMDSMQMGMAGTYLETMEKNLEVVQEALK